MKIKKYRLYRVCEEDVLGELRTKIKVNKLSERLYDLHMDKQRAKGGYIYRLNVVKPRLKRSRKSIYKAMLLYRKKILLFYGGYKLGMYRKLCKKVLEKRGSFTDNIIYMLEGRLCMVVYRLNIASTVDEAKYLIKRGAISVNKEIKENTEYLVEEGDLIEVIEPYKQEVYARILDRVKKKWYYTSLPKHLEMNYKVLVGVFLRKPKFADVGYPFQLDEEIFYSIYVNRIR